MTEPTTDNGNTEHDTTNLVPAHVIETKRAEREQRTKLANTIAGDAAKDEEAATS